MDDGSLRSQRSKTGLSNNNKMVVSAVSPTASLDSSDGCSTNQSYVSYSSEKDATTR